MQAQAAESSGCAGQFRCFFGEKNLKAFCFESSISKQTSLKHRGLSTSLRRDRANGWVLSECGPYRPVGMNCQRVNGCNGSADYIPR